MYKKDVQKLLLSMNVMRSMAATEFKAKCLRVIKQMKTDREPVTITNRGQPVAVLSPLPPGGDQTLVGAMRGSVLSFEDPFSPAASPTAWSANK